jgi:hypothetical protein
LPDELVELGALADDSVDDDSIVTAEIENTYLQRRPVTRWPDEHRQIVIHIDSPRCGANGVPDVGIIDAVFPGWLADPHADTMFRPRAYVNKCCLSLFLRRRARTASA